MPVRAYLGPRLGRRSPGSRARMATPANLGAAVQLWVRGDLGITGTSPVTAIRDQSANGVLWDTVGAGTTSTVAGALNGKQVLQFPSGAYILRTSGAASTNPGWSFALVSRWTAAAGDDRYLVNGAGANTDYLRQYRTGSNTDLRRYAGGGSATAQTAYADAYETWCIASDGSYTRHNGVEIGYSTTQDSTSQWAAGGQIGGPGSGNLFLAELVICQGLMTARKLAPYILDRYALTL